MNTRANSFHSQISQGLQIFLYQISRGISQWISPSKLPLNQSAVTVRWVKDDLCPFRCSISEIVENVAQVIKNRIWFLPRDAYAIMHSADYAVARCLSVRPSHAGIVSKRLHTSSKFFHHRVAPAF